MKRRNKLGLLAVLAFASAALADRTVVYSSTNARVVSMTFYPRAGGAVTAVVCGATTATAGAPDLPCQTIELANSNAIAIEVMSLANNEALTFWKGAVGL